MGNCLGNQKTRKKQSLDYFDQQPTDTETLDKINLPTLIFHALLTNVKIKRCSYGVLSMKFQFGGFEEFELAQKRIQKESAKWSVQYKIQFKTNEYEMRKKFLTITVMDNTKKVVGSLKINLYILANGPYHQDFSVNLLNDKTTRLSFNLKLAQFVKLKLQTCEAQMVPLQKQYPGDRFAFSIRSIMSDKVDESSLSYTNVIAFDSSETSQEEPTQIPALVSRISKQGETGNKNNKKLKRTQSFRAKNAYQGEQQQVKKKQIKWSGQVSSQMPLIQQNLPFYQIHSTSLNIIFWSLQESTQLHQKKQIESECFVSLNKLLTFPFTIVRDSNSVTFEERKVDIELKTWNHGRQVGKGLFRFKFLIQTHLKQMQVCVRTENGILQTSPVFSGEDGGSSNTEQIQELKKLTNQIQSMFIDLADMVNSKKNQLDITKTIQEIIFSLKRQRTILMKSTKESKLTYDYKNQNQLLKGQKVLIDLGFKILACLSQDCEEINVTCWSLLSTLVKRGELTLAHMGYSKTQKEQCSKGEPSSFTKKKHQVSITYQLLMIQLLKVTLKALNNFISESQKEFAELFCAYAYFRIPVFRDQILNVITKSDDPEIQEWRGTQFNLYQASTISGAGESKNVFEIMFDWESNFYKMIEKDERYAANQVRLKEILSVCKWEQRMAKRGGAFFAFVRYWVSYVQNIAINSKHVNWKYFPGYNKILHSFLVQMKNKSINQYSDVMKKAAANLLSNQKLLNPFVLIVFKKTNINEQASIIRAFDIINAFIESIKTKGRSIPSAFDFKLFLKGVKSILEGESSFGMGKVLVLIYDQFKVFPVEFRIQLSMYFLTKVFFRLFLHWSPNVRTIYHHLLYIRIYHESSKPFDQLDFKDQQIFKANPEYRTQIVSRYQRLMIMLENAQLLQGKIKKNVRNMINDKDLHKKLKQKIADKRRQKFKAVDAENDRASNKMTGHKLKVQEKEKLTLMEEITRPRLQRYNSELLNKNLRIAIQSAKTAKKDEVIMRKNYKDHSEVTGEEDRDNTSIDYRRRRKTSFFQASLQDQLTAMNQSEISYVSRSLNEYNRINQVFIKSVGRNKDSVPVVRMQMSLDEKELRPQGIDLNIDDW